MTIYATPGSEGSPIEFKSRYDHFIGGEWVPPAKQSQIGATFTKIAKPTLQCMFEPVELAAASPQK